MPSPTGNVVWMDGIHVLWDQATTHVLDYVLHYGCGVFEGIRSYETHNKKNAAIFRADDHIKRLYHSASVLDMEIPFHPNEIKEAMISTIAKNHLKDSYIRPLVWMGKGEMGLHAKENQVRTLIAAWNWGKYLGEKPGVRVTISSVVRNHPKSFPPGAKICGSYVNSRLASIEAKRRGFDEALMLDDRGYVSEGPGENVFFVKGSMLITPAPYNILEGITRQSIMDLGAELSFPTVIKEIKPDELKDMDEAFFVGTAAEVTPILEIDKIKFGDGKPGKITTKIQDIYYKTVRGFNPDKEHWLTYIYPREL